MPKAETLEMIEAAERRMRGVTKDEGRRTGGVTASRDDGDDFSDFVDDGEDRDTLNARPQRIEDIDTAAVYAKFNKRNPA
jgi:hypothetical protein